jgi:hypothetical protein
VPWDFFTFRQADVSPEHACVTQRNSIDLTLLGFEPKIAPP